MDEPTTRIKELWNDSKHYQAGMIVKDYLNRNDDHGFQVVLSQAGMTTRENIMNELTADIDRLKQAQEQGQDLSTSLLDPLSDMTLEEAYHRLHSLNHEDYAIYKINGQNHQYNGIPAGKDDLLNLIQ